MSLESCSSVIGLGSSALAFEPSTGRTSEVRKHAGQWRDPPSTLGSTLWPWPPCVHKNLELALVHLAGPAAGPTGGTCLGWHGGPTAGL
eukprot:6678524-Pyramimonas_sp.AAC.1